MRSLDQYSCSLSFSLVLFVSWLLLLPTAPMPTGPLVPVSCFTKGFECSQALSNFKAVAPLDLNLNLGTDLGLAHGWGVSPMNVRRRWGTVPLSSPQAVWRASLPGTENFQDPELLLEQLLPRECPHFCQQSLQGPLRLCTLGSQHPVGTLSRCPCRWSSAVLLPLLQFPRGGDSVVTRQAELARLSLVSGSY